MEKRDRQAKFEELAERRVNEALRRIKLVGKLSNRSNYAYTEDHARQIIRAFEDEIRTLKSKFQNEDGETQAFKFKIRPADQTSSDS